ncbi:MAG TPA: type IV pilus biogenesis/stability protein PilW, partial [Alcanivorax sp.]|nr:type IV pilus biogenesis/stability protein PilW [Alcanivorax sp.]
YHYRKALSADRNYAPALNNYGTLLYTQRRYEEALEKFKRAANDPNYEGRASAFSNMGQSYAALDRPGDAKDAFIRALRLNGRSTHATLQLAKLYHEEGRHQMGWDYYKQYERRIGRQSAEGLWTGIQLAAALGLQDQQSSYELALQNLYPGTREHKLWQEWRSAQEGRQ